MIRGLLILLLFLGGVALSEFYFKKFQALEGEKLVRSEVRDIEIKLYGEKGLEWVILGEKLFMEGSNLRIEKSVMLSGGYRIESEALLLNRKTRKGLLRGEVEITGEDLYLKTTDAYIDFGRSVAWGENRILLRRGGNIIRGRGFKIVFRPFRVTINEVESVHPS
ncbi:MAG: hypothetical protein GXN96_01605 [Aquificae bacterium]|nr:hypothetical protein [Aquificota bacterium]